MKRYLLLIFLSLLPLIVSAYDAKIEGIYYIFYKDEAIVTYAYNTSIFLDIYESPYWGAVVIPEHVTNRGKTYRVTRIGIHAFDGCKGLTSIDIPNSVTYIDNFAFNKCFISKWCKR